VVRVGQDLLAEERAPPAGFQHDVAIQRVDHLDLEDVGMIQEREMLIRDMEEGSVASGGLVVLVPFHVRWLAVRLQGLYVGSFLKITHPDVWHYICGISGT
jgi:hypothetical protein